MSSAFIDVHTFDGKWTTQHNIETTVSLENKNKLYKWYLDVSKIYNTFTVDGLKGIMLIMENTQQFSNNDHVNKIFADDILTELLIISRKLEKAEKKEVLIDLLKNIDEQSKDMFMLGQCPSGRVTRLFQLYSSYKDFLKKE